MMNKIIFLSFIAALASCSSPQPLKYQKADDVTDSQYERDQAFCEMEGRKTVGVAEDAEGKIYTGVYNPCMRSKGHKPVVRK